jgi:hypothetical protein
MLEVVVARKAGWHWLETVGGGVVLMAVSGLTLVAYKHPAGYQRIVTGIAVPLVIGIGIIVAFNIGKIMASIDFLDSKVSRSPDDPIGTVADSIREVRDAIRVAKRVYWIAVVVSAHLAFLWFLPQILGLE